MNEFFKYLVPELLKYFNNDNEILEVFIPKLIEKKYEEVINRSSEKK